MEVSGGSWGGGAAAGRRRRRRRRTLNVFSAYSLLFFFLKPFLASKSPNTNPSSLDLKKEKEKEKESYLLLTRIDGDGSVLWVLCVVSSYSDVEDVS